MRRNFSSKGFIPTEDPLMHDTSSSEEEDEQANGMGGRKSDGTASGMRTSFMNSRVGGMRATRFNVRASHDENEDNYVQNDDDEGDEQLEKMRRLEAERKLAQKTP